MATRLWGLSRRQTIVALGVAVLIGVVLAFALPRGDHSSPSRHPSHSLWAFGFATARINPETLQPSPHPLPQGFGSVLSTPGAVYLFEPVDGRVGLLDAARNTLEVIGRIPPGGQAPGTVDPLIATSSSGLWLVSTPGTLTRFDLGRRRAGGSVRLGATGRTAPPTTTRVVTSGDSVIAVSEVAGGYAVDRISASGRTVAKAGIIAGRGPITGLAADGRSVWIATASVAMQVNARTLRVTGEIGIPVMPSQASRGLAVTHGGLWTLGGNGSTLVRVDLVTHHTDVALHLLPAEPSSFREPASLVTDDGHVWVMVQRTDDAQDHSVRIAGVTLAGRATKAADLPTELFIGAIAVT